MPRGDRGRPPGAYDPSAGAAARFPAAEGVAVVSRSQRSTIWFFVFLIALLVAGFYGLRAAATADACGDLPKRWSWERATWECPVYRF
jgi:hypothetical protein